MSDPHFHEDHLVEREVVERATVIDLPGVGRLRIARSEELLAMKVLSMSDRRLQDRIDARNLILYGDQLDLTAVTDNLDRIVERGFDRGEDLHEKLASLLDEAKREE